jgi:hypothetical protein
MIFPSVVTCSSSAVCLIVVQRLDRERHRSIARSAPASGATGTLPFCPKIGQNSTGFGWLVIQHAHAQLR